MASIKITGVSEPIEVSEETTLLALSKQYRHLFKNPILLANVNNSLYELHKTPPEDATVTFLDMTDANGFRAYQRSAAFLMIYAIKSVLGEKTRVAIEHSISQSYYCEIPDQNIVITDALLAQIETKMQEAVQADLPIEKHAITLTEGQRLAEQFGLQDKKDLLHYRRAARVNFYKLDWFYDYFYGPMLPSTSFVSKFKLRPYSDGFMLQFPGISNTDSFSELRPLEKVIQVFKESNRWARILEVDTVGALNNTICAGGLAEIIRVSEALHEKKTAHIAETVCEQQKNLVLIAGPSSSGKTTFAMRLCIQLRASGRKPHLISLDNYYLNRANVPLDQFGKPDLETLDAIDVAQVNCDLQRLLKGETVEIPSFNFLKGKREYKGNFIQLGEDDILVMEGIHGLNERLTDSIPRKDKFKIFISALTQLNIDDHNHISTSDTRLIRRIARDQRHRGKDAAGTIAMWPSVQRGERAYIFPYQGEADAFFNSALVYEMCVLKQYVEPLLFRVTADLPQHIEARRLIKFLDCFLCGSGEQIPQNSILREFIGGSCFG